MIQMMMYTQQTGDQEFRAMMHDFVDTYRLKVATTEDFKAVVEKHMQPSMDLDHNHRMDWFFNEYVYGTDLPQYHFESQVDSGSDVVKLHFKLTQSGVPEGFKMLVPIYVELTDGRSVKVGAMAIAGNTSADHSFQMPKTPAPVKRLSIDLNHDVLAIEN
jgi:aminopeptidase N